MVSVSLYLLVYCVSSYRHPEAAPENTKAALDGDRKGVVVIQSHCL